MDYLYGTGVDVAFEYFIIFIDVALLNGYQEWQLVLARFSMSLDMIYFFFPQLLKGKK